MSSAFRNSISLALSVVFIFSGCSWIRQATGEKEPLGLSSTGLGAATGALLGTGLGAIIGSQSGNPGAGIAIGGLAGAAFGGALGAQEDRDESVSQELALRAQRQDELLQANRKRIEEYKKSSDIKPDRRGALVIPTSSVSSSSSSSRSIVNTPSGYRGNPRAVPFSELDSSPAPRAANTELRSEVRSTAKLQPLPSKTQLIETKPAKLASKASKFDLVPEEPPVSEVPEVRVPPAKIARELTQPAFKPEPAKGGLPKANGLPEATNSAGSDLKVVDSTASVVAEADESMKEEIAKGAPAANAPAVSGGIVGIPVAPKKEDTAKAEEIKTTVITGTKNSKLSADDDCARADQEFQRATTSVSDADKLFYLRRALRLCSTKANIHLSTGRVYAKLGRVEDAEYEFRQALDLEPKNAEAEQELSNLKKATQ